MKVIQTSGKRKKAIARATLKQGKGIVRVNGTLVENMPVAYLRNKILEPVLLANSNAKKVDIKISVRGGGVTSQAEAARLAIARALVEFDENLKNVYLDYDRLLLVADTRNKERCKPNDSKARAKRQKSYR